MYILTVNQGESIAFYLQQKLIVLMVRETFQSRSNQVVELTAITNSDPGREMAHVNFSVT